MTLLLTILSVLALWSLLGLLIVGLLLILKPLQSIRGYLEKITMGVRAIEHELAPLGTHAAGVGAGVLEATAGLGAVANRLGETDRALAAAAPALAPRKGG